MYRWKWTQQKDINDFINKPIKQNNSDSKIQPVIGLEILLHFFPVAYVSALYTCKVCRLFELFKIDWAFFRKERPKNLIENWGQDHTNRLDLFSAYNS